MALKLKLTNVERGGVRTAYTASIESDGQAIGYVQRLRGESNYYAYVDGRRVGRATTLAGICEDIRIYVEQDRAAPSVE